MSCWLKHALNIFESKNRMEFLQILMKIGEFPNSFSLEVVAMVTQELLRS